MAKKRARRKRGRPLGAGPGSPADRNLEAVHREFMGELEQGLRVIEKTIGTLYKGPLGFLVSNLMQHAFHFFALPAAKRRGRERVNFFFEIVREAHRSGDAEGAAKKMFEEFLRHNEPWVRADHHHPKAKELRGLMWKELMAHLDLVLPLVKAKGGSYEELVRDAYPKRKEIQGLVEAQIEAMEEQVRLIRTEPDLLHIPSVLRPEVARVVDAGLDYARRRFRERLDTIYK
ncbi:MAG: hypothetical protein HY558_02705 [Euryarchaeota archaeon]|nr:hypothetical protein [Euryarchaeota archaeon]